MAVLAIPFNFMAGLPKMPSNLLVFTSKTASATAAAIKPFADHKEKFMIFEACNSMTGRTWPTLELGWYWANLRKCVNLGLHKPKHACDPRGPEMAREAP